MSTTPSTRSPAFFWRLTNALKGTNNTLLTSKEVPDADLTGKWILITGGNNGIGFEAAKTFAKWGANIVLACREPPESETHPSTAEEECRSIAKSAGHSSTIEWWKVDLTDLRSIADISQRWLDTQRPLDILCNNAGVSATPPSGKTIYTKDGFEFSHQMWVKEMHHRLLRNEKLKHITINASKLAITPQQGSLAIVNAVTSPALGPDPKIQGVGSPDGKGGGHYINRIWVAEAMPYCDDENARQEVWEKIDEELSLEEKGLYSVFDI
ncbi:hypothetical protein G7Z17_g11616 [Cylindrodendrum hubeiense]|uniref:NAD(P)-binding protein n=1 Tax=Cylindrodendrum hubeiense TaxID=595255 RepID=A0A9P5GWT4_9HYPO|nr:hypothetical protein G7Z17_g11616 [Cylindrodendrum hubeiense]